MVEAAFAFLTALLAALPQILTMIETRHTAARKVNDALVNRSLTELSAGVERVRHGSPTV